MRMRGAGAAPAAAARAAAACAAVVRPVAAGAAVVSAVVCATLVGCATTVTGQGQPATGGTTGPAASSEPASTGAAPGPGLPSLPLPPPSGANPDPEIPDSPCDVLDREELKQQFGPGAAIDTELDGCKVTAADGSFLSFHAYPALTLSYEKRQEAGRPVTIAGQPAYLAQRGHYLVVSRSKNPDDRGIVTCYVGFSGSSQINGIQLATRLLEEMMPHYTY
jgi:hypothetical protein